ncbi:MAG: hypothetical protein K0Q83_1485 [Deltaproteobacteria bacterium]|nr:hypothetical protein [Deltaproteobacteria bacterium]
MPEQHCTTPPVEHIKSNNDPESSFIGRLINSAFYELHATQYYEG